MKRKRIIAVILVIMMSLSIFVGCGTRNNVKEALQGTWTAEWIYYGKQLSRYFTFEGDTYTTGGTAVLGKVDPKTGTYEIKASVIHLIRDDSVECDLEYTYNKANGTITLWWGDQVLKKEN